MSLAQLHVHAVRNIVQTRLDLHARFNLFIGPNGSGKSSLLEAIYLLGTGHSFRTRETAPLIHYTKEHLAVFSRLDTEDTISLQKSKQGPTQVKINGQLCRSSSELAQFLPCQLVYQDLFDTIDAGPKVRRQLLDWGVFHVEPTYHGIWMNYRRVLKQRNHLLRQKAPYHQCEPWDKQLSELAHQLDSLRQVYFSKLAIQFEGFIQRLSSQRCVLQYEKGWDRRKTGNSLLSLLAEQYSSDCQRQYTLSGPHQADIQFELEADSKAKTHLSRGQQKIILIALKLAQAAMLTKPCTYLLDDLAAELDKTHLKRVFACLCQQPGQFFITGLDESLTNLVQSDMEANSYELASGEIRFVSRET